MFWCLGDPQPKTTGVNIQVPRPARTERAEPGRRPRRIGGTAQAVIGRGRMAISSDDSNGPPRPAKARRQTGQRGRLIDAAVGQAAGRAAPADLSGLAPDHDKSGAPVPRGTNGSDANPAGEGVCFDFEATS
jgi:hypothetical protein